MLAVAHILLVLVIPAAALFLERRLRWVRAAGAVVPCYAIGMLGGSLGAGAIEREVSMSVCRAAVGLAIPLLVFSVDIVAWLRMSRATVVSFGGCIAAVVVASVAAHALFAGMDGSAAIAGMLVGVYTGGSPNLAAIGTALGVAEETIVTVNGADILLGSGFLLLLLTVLPRIGARLLPPYPRAREEVDFESADVATADRGRGADMAVGVVLAAALVGIAVFVGDLAPEPAREPVTLLALSTLAVAASLHPRIRGLRGTQQAGQYALLVFAVAIGTTANLAELAATSPAVILYTATVLVLAIVGHLLFCMVARIDRDTALMTVTAAIYGPPFVGVVAAALRNREVVVAGLASGLVGLALGNYLGLGLAWLLSGG